MNDKKIEEKVNTLLDNVDVEETAEKLGIDKQSPEKLIGMMDGLNSQALSMGSSIIANMALKRLKFGLESSKQFKSSEEQVDSFLKKMPSMTAWREQIIEKARKFRKDNGLAE